MNTKIYALSFNLHNIYNYTDTYNNILFMQKTNWISRIWYSAVVYKLCWEYLFSYVNELTSFLFVLRRMDNHTFYSRWCCKQCADSVRDCISHNIYTFVLHFTHMYTRSKITDVLIHAMSYHRVCMHVFTEGVAVANWSRITV